MDRCKDCEFDHCSVESKYGDMDCYAYIIYEKVKPYKEALKNIKELAKVKIKWCERGNRYCNKCKCICSEYEILQQCEVLKDE